jgi:filamentous hemagglutinin family protein
MTLRKMASRRPLRKSIIAIAIQHCFDGCAVVATAGLLACNPVQAQTARNWSGKIPLPSGPVVANNQVAGSSTIYQPQVVTGFNANPYTVSGTTGTITQRDAAGILRWASFDIAPGYTVNIDQPSTSSILLNKVDGGAFFSKTVIDGMLQAKGQVYIYNPNGIIFGKTSQVDVNSLVATSLRINDNRFLAGLIAPSADPIFSAVAGTPPGTVEVEAQAQVNAAKGGRIMLVGSGVSNSGQLSAPDGQVLAIAASDKVFLAAPHDVTMRGLLVEVGSGGTVSNETLGSILVGHGNASLVGYAVNQNGTISATTSVQANGSIYLRARDGATKPSDNAATSDAYATRGGTLTLGENSVTEVLPDIADTSTAAKTSYNASQIDLAAKSVHLLQNAKVIAQGGDVTVSAQADPRSNNRSTSGIVGGSVGSSGVYLESGATIDVSGTTTTQLAMESNVIAVQLRGTELADVPLQRNSVLRGQTVYIDRRKGTPLANVQGYLDLAEYTVGEETATGGTVTFKADQEVVIASGAKVNVSGGQVTYKSGYVATTQLQSGRSTVDIGSASPDRIYTGFTNPAAGPRNFEAGYSDGRSAGSVRFDAPGLILRGSLLGTVTPGSRQRDIAASNYPQGGELIIGSNTRLLSSALGAFSNFSFIGSINFGGTTTANIATPVFGTAWDLTNPQMQKLRSTLDLDPVVLAEQGFTRINAYAREDAGGVLPGTVTVSSSLSLKPGGEFRVAAQDTVSLNENITIPGGNIEAKAVTGKLSVGANVAVNVAGLWTNDRSSLPSARDAAGNPVAPLVTQGGSITLTGKGNSTDNIGLDLGNNTRFDASGGAWQNTSGKIVRGNGGALSFTASPQDETLPQTAGFKLGNDVTFAAYSLSKGGTLKLSGRDVVLGTSSSANDGDLALAADWFTEGGFSKYDINAAGNLKVLANSVIAPTMDYWIANRNTATASGGNMASAFSVCRLPACTPLGSRAPASLSLSASAQRSNGWGQVWIQQGAVISTDPGATVTLAAGRQLTDEGRITNPGGTVNLLLSVDPGNADIPYRAERSIWLGSTAVVDVSGTAAGLWTNGSGITQGNVLNGGSIRIGRLSGSDLAAAAGYVVMEKRSLLDVSGVSASMTLSSGRGGLQTQQVASAGGSIDIRAREGMLIEGSLSGAGGNSGAAGGSLNLILDREGLPGASSAPSADRELVVLSQKFNAGTANETIVPQTLHADQAFDSSMEGKAYVLASTLSGGSFDRIGLKSQNKINFDAAAGDVALAARTSVSIDAPVIGVSNGTAASNVSLASANVSLGNSDWRYQAAGTAASASLGDGATLNVNGTTINLTGSSALQGFATANFNAGQDIRLAGVVAQDLSLTPVAPTVIHAYGNLKGVGQMNFTSAQLYPTTMSEFSLSSSGTNSQITFRSNGGAAPTPLSAAGKLAVSAKEIVQDGVVRAPFGNITFNADDMLIFGNGSLTSVAGSGRVPLGRVSNGRDWLYDFGNGNTVTLNDLTASNGVSLPEKKITANGKSIDVANGAVIDLSGGGDLYAYEFTAGPGGSRDVLAKVTGASSTTVFAVMPGYGSAVAPIDFQYQQDGGLAAGDKIYLSGAPGLPAGFYALLPAHYALLPGAFAVTVAAGTSDMKALGNYAKMDGTWVVAGYQGSAAANNSRWSGFLVQSGDQVRTRSAYSEYLASGFSLPASELPQNGGHVVFNASENLSLNGQVKLGSVTAGGKAGIADISAPDIRVVGDASQSTGSAIKLVVADLMAMGADSLLLGGVRDTQSDGTHVTVGANSVTLDNDSAHPLSGPEIILAAKDEVRLKSGSKISSSGTPGTSSGDLIMNGSGADADGALVRVSGGPQVAVVRNPPPGAKGTLAIEAGATLAATGSMILDATRLLDNQGSVELGKTAAMSLGANRISFGDTIPGAATGLRFDSAALANLNKLADLSLTSYSTFDFYGSVNLGRAATLTDPATSTLSLRGAGIQSYASATDQVVLTADTVRFDGGGTYALTTPAGAPAGNLAVNARDVQVGSNSFAIKGYTDVNVTAQREVVANGKKGVLSTTGAMTVASGRITTATGADATLQAGGALVLTGVASPEAASTPDGLGGKLAFIGDSIVSDGNIVAKAGQIKMTAQGTAGVHVSGGEINAAGYAKTFGSTVAYAPGGSINLDGGAGNITVDAAATLDVSAVGADAGLIAVKATNGSNGQAFLNGTMKGRATAGLDGIVPSQGRFSLDVDQVAQFGTLNGRLNSAGFTESRDIRVRHGNVALAAGESIVAHNVSIAADNGNVRIGGVINADGAKGGSIQLYASQASASGGSGNVTLESTATLSAKATQTATSAAGSAGDGGSVIIGTGTADGLMVATTNGGSSIDVQAGASIDVSGNGSLGQGGTVTLRAPRVGNGAGSDVAIAQLAGTITGSRETVVEAFKTYSGTQITANPDVAGSNLDATTSGIMYTEAASFSNNAAAIAARLGTGADVKIRTGVEVRSVGDLLVSVNETAPNAQDRGWDLNTWRFNGEPGVLSLRAAGDLTVKGSISDGFVNPGSSIAMPGWAIDPNGSDSWGYRLAGGADLSAANPLKVIGGTSKGDVTLTFARTASTTNDQPVALIRTGTGRIDIAAGQDVILGSTTVNIPNPYDSASTVSATLGATIYTAGRYTALENGFLAPKNQTVNSIYTNGTKVTTNASFATGGGAITIAAERDVVGAVTRQLVNDWLFRRGQVTTDASGNTIFGAPLLTDGNTPTTRYEAVLSTGWWSRYDYFNQGIATFGGGDISVTSGRNVENLSLNAATSGQVPADANKHPTTLFERGGGDIVLHAAGDIRGGSYYVQKGNATLVAGGSVVAGDNVVPDDDLGQVTLRPVLALGDGRISITAVGNAEIETAFNPTLVLQSTYNADSSASLRRRSTLSVFSTYSADSSVSMTSLSGDIYLGNHTAAVNTAANPWTSTPDTTYLVYPASFKAVAMSGSIRYANGFSLWASPVGQLALLAQESVLATYPRRSDQLNIFGVQPIAMIDAAPSFLPSVLTPQALIKAYSSILNPSADTDGLAYHTNGGLHAGDSEPVRIVALTGDIVGENYYGGSNGHDTLIAPKAAEILAGRDIRDFGFKIQQLSTDDVTTISAGRDFIDSSFPDLSPVRHILTGPGRLDITAGRNIDLGTGSGIVTRGNLDNPYLPEAGASINLIAGAKPDYANFASQYLSAEEFSLLTHNDLVALNDIFFEKLRQVSGATGGGALDLVAFDAVIASLFPTASISGGDINVFGSQVKTSRGGSINMFAPGGSVQAGLAEKPAWVKNRLLSDKSFESNLGVYTIAGGNLQALVKKDFLVNQGRVFTLGGGDITLVSQYGNIDAGKGAKTAQSTPPPVIKTDEKGNTVVDISGSISGSGIATLRTSPDVPASSVYPIAPRGTFDAGDAGVRSSGDFFVVAQTVLNASNIAAAGSVSGTKTTDASGLGGAVAAPANTPVTKTDALSNPAGTDPNAASSLTVELLGYGDAPGAGPIPDKGQQAVTQGGQTPTPAETDDQRKKKKLL